MPSQYNASKAALVHLAKSLAVEWVDFARVNCISPGFIETDLLATHPKEWRDKWFTMIPAARLCDPYELKGVGQTSGLFIQSTIATSDTHMSQAYVFCASDASSYMTGANIVIDGVSEDF